MLVKKVYFDDFLNEFEKFDRVDSFTYEGKKALYNYLYELGEEIGQPIELDIISICGEFTEYECLEQFNHDYGYAIGHNIEDIDDIEDYTTVIKIDEEGFIIQDF